MAASSSPLRDYLNKHFPAELWVDEHDPLVGAAQAAKGKAGTSSSSSSVERTKEAGWTDKELMEHFFTLYGVNVFTEGSVFYQFKYEMCLTETWNEEVKEARGIIFERRCCSSSSSNTDGGGPDGDTKEEAAGKAESGGGRWAIVARPFEKFFNQQESECPVSNSRVFDAHCDEFAFAEKADGTCIQFWWSSPETLDAVHQTMLQWANDSRATTTIEASVADDEEREITEKDDQEEGEDAEVGRDEEQVLKEEEAQQQGLGKASLIEKRARRFKKVLPRVLQPSSAAEGDTDEAPKHARGLVRKPQSYNGWRISTLGMVTPAVLFEQLFWGLFLGERKQDEYSDTLGLFDVFDKDWTYLFELCCEQNQVVNKYTKDMLYLIGARHRESGKLLDREDLDKIAERLGQSVSRPRFYDFTTIGVKNLKQANEWIDKEAKRTDLYGATPEGFVVYWNSAPVAKMKNRFYTDKHLLITGNLLSNRNIAIERYFDGTIDDVLDVLPEPIHAFHAELKEKTKHLIHELSTLVQQFVDELPEECFDPASRNGTRSYAKAIAEKVDPKYKGLMFQLKDDVLRVEGPDRKVANLDRLVFGWLKNKNNYSKFNALWKATNVKEILDDERIQAGGNYKTVS